MRGNEFFIDHPGGAGRGVGEGLNLPLPHGPGGDIGRQLRALDRPTPVVQAGGYTVEAIGPCLDAVLAGFGAGARA